MRRVVLLNDTRGHHHFGCHRVMETIEQKLAGRGFEVAARSLVRQRWWENEEFLRAMQQSDLIVINGEGTLHHGSRHGPGLLKIAEHPLRGDTPVALVNAIYQDNPPEWKQYIDRIDYLNTRDSWSARELEQIAGREVRSTLDFSLSGGEPQALAAGRNQLALGDSVVRKTNRALVRLARSTPGSVFLPIVRTMKSSKPQYNRVRYALREAYVFGYTFLFQQYVRNALFCRDHHEYSSQLQKCLLHVTGRFHGVCLSIASNTPFVTSTSNSWKIEALLNDIGFSQERVKNLDQLGPELLNPHKWAFSDEEQQLLIAARARAEAETNQVFDEIAALVGSGEIARKSAA